MNKIELVDSFLDVMVKMSEGNPGACVALAELANASTKIDPQSAFGGFSPAIAFDSHGIYGSSIYIIWSDKCGRDARKTLMLLRAVQLGLFPKSKLQEMAADQARKINLTTEEWDSLDSLVCARLEEFQKPQTSK